MNLSTPARDVAPFRTASLVTAPSLYPVTAATVQEWLLLDAGQDEQTLQMLIAGATGAAEGYLGRSLINRTLKLVLDGWPGAQTDTWWSGVRQGPVSMFSTGWVELPHGPVSAIGHVKTYDEAGDATTFAASNYYLDGSSRPPRLVLKRGQTWPAPGRDIGGIEIQYTAGYGATAEAVPADIRQGILRHVAHGYEHRGEDGAGEAIPAAARAFYDRHRKAAL